MRVETYFQIGLILIATTVVSAVATGCLFWIRWFRGTAQRNLCGDRSAELVTRLPQPPPRWSVFDFLVMFGMMILVGSLLRPPPAADTATTDTPNGAAAETTPAETAGDETASAETAPDETSPAEKPPAERNVELASAANDLVRQVAVHFLANLTAFVFTLIYLRSVRGATLAQLSLIPSRADVRRGLFATLWILAPVLLLNVVVSNLVQYAHPVTDLLAEESGTRTFVALMLSAAVLTPIVEEFQFRLLLQGGLQSLADPPEYESVTAGWQPSTAWPIYVTSLVFALMHAGQGAAPIPLFFLSIGLGFLYQRTGRLVPAIIVHMLLNGATLSMEFCRVNAGL